MRWAASPRLAGGGANASSTKRCFLRGETSRSDSAFRASFIRPLRASCSLVSVSRCRVCLLYTSPSPRD
eukprot:10831978-Alexandrium_andersonii.AAC.1